MYLPKVSIQIPTYNQAAFIGIAIESCLAQTYTNIEFIIADDASADNTKEVVNKYVCDKRVKYYCNGFNLGRVANYRKALYQYATGEWVLNLDGDDYFTNEDFIKNAVDNIMSEGVNDVLFYQGTHVLPIITKQKSFNLPTAKKTIVLSAKNYVKNFFTDKKFSHMSILYNRQVAINAGFYEKDILSADIYSFLKLSIFYPDKKIILSKEISGIWVQHNTNTSKTLKFKPHVKNFSLYISLFFLQIKSKKFSILSSVIWLYKAFYNYWAGWFKQKIKLA